MIDETASLGLAIDSSQVADANVDLDRFQQACAKTEAAARRFGATVDSQMAKTLSGFDRQLEAAVGDLNVHTVAVRNNTTLLDQNAKAHGGLSSQAMAAQHSIRSMIEQLALGVPPSMVLTQQMNHLSYAATGPGGLKGAFAEAALGLRSFLTPTTLAVGGIAAVTAGVYFANQAWEAHAKKLDNVARAANLTIGSLRALETAASVGGIDSFLKDAGKFSSEIYDASEGMGSLATLLRANNDHASTFVGTLESVASIIQHTKSEQQALNLLQQAGIPATAEYVRWLRQGPDAIRQAVAESGRLTTSEQQLIDQARQFDQAWAESWSSFASLAERAFISAKGGMQAFLTWYRHQYQDVHPGDINTRIGGAFGDLSYSNTALQRGLENRARLLQGQSTAVDPRQEIENLQRLQQRIGLLGNLATVEQRVAATRASLTAAGLQGAGVDRQQVDAILNVTRVTAEGQQLQDRAANGLVNSTELMLQKQHELAILTANGTLTQRQASTALENYATHARDAADAAAVYASKLPQLTQLTLDAANLNKQLDTLATTALGGVSDGLVSVMDGTKSAGDAFKNMGQQIETAIARMIVQMTVIQPIAAALKATLGGIGGGSGVLSALGIGGVATAPGVSAVGHNASGTDNWRGGPTIVGEKGPELINVPMGAQIIPNERLRSGGAPPSVVQPVINIFNAPPGTTVTHSTTSSGQPQIDVTIRRRVDTTSSDLIASGESQLNRTLEQRYGLRPVL